VGRAVGRAVGRLPGIIGQIYPISVF